jgi:hypothetical protein
MNPPPTGEITNHGGLTFAALENVRLFIAETVFFERTLVVPATRSGGVSQPWSALRIRIRNAEIHRIALADAVRKTTAG